MIENPYKSQPEHAFWCSSIGSRHYADIAELWRPMHLKKSDQIATAGSCFAQHIGNNLLIRGAKWMDMEPAPPLFGSDAESRKWGFGIFSCRYGNIYTTRQLIQLFDEAHGNRTPEEIVWERNGRYFDALRPSVDPIGHDNPESIIDLRRIHLSAVKRMFAQLDVFVFTLGLTEGWESASDGTMFPMAPGTVAGNYVSEKYKFHNLRHVEIRSDIEAFRKKLLAINPNARILLTVSPVPLAATASDNHVMVATVYSKSVLRAVAGELSEDYSDVFYFPSYEIVNAHPSRAIFYDPDLRNVNAFGVSFVMKQFFTGSLAKEFGETTPKDKENDIELMCDEETLEK